MADLNRWTRTLERRSLEGLRAEIDVLRAACPHRDRDDRMQRRAFKRVLDLIDAKLLTLREQDEAAESQSADDIDEGLKA